MKYSKYRYGEDIKFKVCLLSEETFHYIKNFKCGNSSINDYLLKKALDDEFGRTYIIIDEEDSVVIGYCTICCSGITHKYQNNIRTLPAIEIRYFAISRRLHKLQYDTLDSHYYFSDYVFSYFLNLCAEISETQCAAKYILLYSVKGAVKFYKRIGFCDFTQFFEADRYRYIDGCRPMYIEIS